MAVWGVKTGSEDENCNGLFCASHVGFGSSREEEADLGYARCCLECSRWNDAPAAASG
jgi:hypothetical protein